MSDKCVICNSKVSHILEINYLVYGYCDSCNANYKNATRNNLREFLKGRGFEEVEEMNGKHIDFVNGNIKIYYRPHLKKWRLHDSNQFNGLDITELVFDYKNFEMSEAEKKHIDEVIIQRLK